MISVVNVILLVSRTESVHTATVVGGFRYAVSYLRMWSAYTFRVNMLIKVSWQYG